ncbi:MAG: hypothetical protein NVS3B20_00950 [Polyangiales bacterium]
MALSGTKFTVVTFLRGSAETLRPCAPGLDRFLLPSTILAAALTIACMLSGCRGGSNRPNCERMKACCVALKGVENGLPKDQEILCHHNPELDEGCAETISDIAKFTPSKNLPAACK